MVDAFRVNAQEVNHLHLPPPPPPAAPAVRARGAASPPLNEPRASGRRAAGQRGARGEDGAWTWPPRGGARAGTSLRVTLPLRSDARVQTPSTNKQTKPGFSVTYRSPGESVI